MKYLILLVNFECRIKLCGMSENYITYRASIHRKKMHIAVSAASSMPPSVRSEMENPILMHSFPENPSEKSRRQ